MFTSVYPVPVIRFFVLKHSRSLKMLQPMVVNNMWKSKQKPHTHKRNNLFRKLRDKEDIESK